jgi:uncharacterized protein (TIGR03435 family)
MIVNPHGAMDDLATVLSGASGRPVINKTHLEGQYSYVLQYAKLDATVSGPDSAPDIFGAIQQQLGLKLESGKAAIPTLIVDRADRVPAGN